MPLLVTGTQAPISGTVSVPNSKYHAHRALILASLAPGRSVITGLSDAGHVHHTLGLLRGLGVRIVVDGDQFIVDGGPYHPVQDVVSAGSSGTTLYFMIGLASLADAPVTITGQKYFQRRPVVPLLRALDQLGVHVDSETGAPPIHLTPGRPTGGTVHIDGTLSQWISGLLLLAPFATSPTTIQVDGTLNERPYLRLTVAMMAQFGLDVEVADNGRRFDIPPNQHPHPADITLPPDVGSAAFGIAAAAVHPADITLQGLTGSTADVTDHPEGAVLDFAREMGLQLTVTDRGNAVRIEHDGSPLKPIRVDCRDTPDILPALATMTSLADGESVFTNINHVRLKESDRASAMLQLRHMGADISLDGDRLTVRGVRSLTGAAMSSFNDHRVLMSLAVAASCATGTSTLTYPNAYRISYPTFLSAMDTLGMSMRVEQAHRRGPRRHHPSEQPTDTQRPLGDWVRRWATERPHDTAVIDVRRGDKVSYSWQQLLESSDQLAAALLELGVRPGERVAYQLPNWYEFVVIAVATAQIGAVSCPIMPIFRQREVSFALRRSAARVVIVPDSFRGRDYRQEITSVLTADDADHDAVRGDASAAAEPLRVRHVIVVPSLASVDPGLDTGHTNIGHTGIVNTDGTDDSRATKRQQDFEARSELTGVEWHHYPTLLATATIDADRLAERAPGSDALAQLLFTSGTSGEPKGVLHTHQVLTRAALMQAHHVGLTDADSIFIPSPLAHQTGFLYGMWLAITLGAPATIQSVWNGATALRALRDDQCTFVQAATPFLADLVATVEGGDRPPESLRIFVATGAAVPRGLAEKATRLLGTTVCGAWGTTETCLGTVSAPTDEPVKVWGTDGRALDGIEIRITDDDGRVLPAETEGNFELRGPTFFTGYLDHPEWTANAYTADGFFRTGDLGIIDQSGYIRITGRVKDVINRGGEKVPVATIEQLLYDHPSVADVAIVAMPDRRLGERACAFVTLAPHSSLTFMALQKYLDSHQVSKHYWPERLEVLDTMPRNAAGKIQKFLLRERTASLAPHQDGGPES